MKYKLTDETKEFCGKLLHRIVCVTAFASVAVGDTGGWVESEKNLSQSGNAWVSGDAKVYGNAELYGDAEVSGDAKVYGNAEVSGDAKVYGNAEVYGDAEVSGNAWVSGDAEVSGNAKVYGDAKVSGNAWVSGDAKVYGNAEVYGDAEVYGNAEVYGDAWVSGDAKVSKSSDYAVYKNSWSSMRYFTWTRSNDKWCVGCFYGSGEELIEKAYKDSKLSGDCYKAVVELRNKLTELESA